jgi:hypothetical protein
MTVVAIDASQNTSGATLFEVAVRPPLPDTSLRSPPSR